MSFGVIGTGGFSELATIPFPDLEYNPVIGGLSEADDGIFFEVLPDVYGGFLTDKDILESVWGGYQQIAADILLQFLCADMGGSLNDCPVDWQRKYQAFEFYTTKEFVTAPTFLWKGNGSSSYVFSKSDQVIDAVWKTGLFGDKAYWALKSGIDQRTASSFQWKATYSRIDLGGYGLLGFFYDDSTALQNSVMVGVGNGGRVAIIQTSGDDTPNMIESAPVIPLDDEVTISVEISEGIITVQAEDSSGTDLLVDTGGLILKPEDAVHTETWAANSFGFCNLDLRTGAFETPTFSFRVNAQVIAQVTSVSYLDESLDINIQDIPFIQDRWVDPTFIAERGVHYELVAESRPFEYLYLDLTDYGKVTLPGGVSTLAMILAEYVSWDIGLIQSNFGNSVGYAAENSELYLRQVQALHCAYWKGPTRAAIRLGVQALLGLPFAYEPGVVHSINPSLTGAEGEIIIEHDAGRRVYRYVNDVDPVVAVGEEVARFQPLTDGVTVDDWRSNPDWFKPYLGGDSSITVVDPFSVALGYRGMNPARRNLPTHEIQKYHTYRVQVADGLFDIALLAPVQTFVDNNRLKWKGVVFSVLNELHDDITIDDDIVVNLTVELEDHGGRSDVKNPRYGDPGEPPYDYQYGMTLTPPFIYNMFRFMFPSDPIDITLTNISGAPASVTVNLVEHPAVPPLGTVTETIP